MRRARRRTLGEAGPFLEACFLIGGLSGHHVGFLSGLNRAPKLQNVASQMRTHTPSLGTGSTQEGNRGVSQTDDASVTRETFPFRVRAQHAGAKVIRMRLQSKYSRCLTCRILMSAGTQATTRIAGVRHMKSRSGMRRHC